MKQVILIADDDPADVYFLREALTQHCPGVAVRDVGDGQEAIDYLSGGGKYADRGAFPLPAHVLLDVKMPRRSGLEVLAWIRDHREFAKLPVTVLSGSQLSGDREQARALGAEYLVKPVGYAELVVLVKSFCQRAGFLPRP